MADPISIISLIEGSISLILQCGSVAKKLSDVAGRYREAKLTVLSMVQEVETIQLAWDRIKQWSHGQAEDKTAVEHDQAFLERIDRSLECGSLVMSALLEDLSEYVDDVDAMNFLQRTKVAWDEKALQDHQHRVRGQVMAMTLLLQVLDLPTSKGRSQLLASTRDQFRKYDESAHSIVPSMMSSRDPSRLSMTSATERYVGAECKDLVYSPLSFENDLFTAMVYKRNYRNPLIRSILQHRSVIADREDSEGTRSTNLSADTGFGFFSELPVGASGLPNSALFDPNAKPRSDENAVGSGRDSSKTVMQQLNSALHMAVRIGKVDLVKTLLAHGAQIDNIPPHSQWSCLHTAVYNQSVPMVECLLQEGAIPDIRREKGQQPIHLAVKADASQIVRMLLDAGANVHGRGTNGEQPIHMAASNAMIDLLLSNGADIKSKDDSGRSPLYLAMQNRTPFDAEILHRLGATSSKDSDSAAQHSYSFLDRSLHLFARQSPRHENLVSLVEFVSNKPSNSDLSFLAALIATISNARAEDQGGNQVFHHLSMRSIFVGNVKDTEGMIKALLERGADINAVNEKGETPLYLVAQSLRVWLIELYLLHGANPLTGDLYKRLAWAFSESVPSPKHAHILQLLETQRMYPPNPKKAFATYKEFLQSINGI